MIIWWIRVQGFQFVRTSLCVFATDMITKAGALQVAALTEVSEIRPWINLNKPPNPPLPLLFSLNFWAGSNFLWCSVHVKWGAVAWCGELLSAGAKLQARWRAAMAWNATWVMGLAVSSGQTFLCHSRKKMLKVSVSIYSKRSPAETVSVASALDSRAH